MRLTVGCIISRIVVRIFLHWRRRRFYAARRSEARASRAFLPFSRSVSASARLARHFSRLIVSFRENKVEPKYFFYRKLTYEWKNMMGMLWLFSTNNASPNDY